jgi:hypothetical protein
MKRSVLRPNRRKGRVPDKQYLAWIHTQPCLCRGPGCRGRIHAHHSGLRGLGQKADDRTALPLCSAHHQNGPDALHVLGKRFWLRHKIDRDAAIARLNALYDSL